MSYVFQDPLSSLDPVRTIGDQVCQPLRIRGVGRKEAKARALDMLGDVGIPDPDRRYGDYPHQFSGGMRQRVMIAMALIGEPRLVIADEPTTALDVRVQAKIIDLLYALTEERGVAVVFITHDLGIVAGLRRSRDGHVRGASDGELRRPTSSTTARSTRTRWAAAVAAAHQRDDSGQTRHDRRSPAVAVGSADRVRISPPLPVRRGHLPHRAPRHC